MRVRPAVPLRRFAAVATTVTLVLSAAAAAGAAPSRVADPPTGGPVSPADVYAYLENPRMTGEGQQAPHAVLRPYGDRRSAIADVTEHHAASPWVASLNGDWRLRMANRPDDVPAGFHGAEFDVARWPTVQVPHTWQSDYLDHPMFRNVPEEIWPDNPPNGAARRQPDRGLRAHLRRTRGGTGAGATCASRE